MFSVKARTRWKSLSFRFHYKFENHISGSLKGWLRVMLQGLVWNECGWFMSFAAELGFIHYFDPGSRVCFSKLSLCVEVNGNSLHRGLGGSISMRNSSFWLLKMPALFQPLTTSSGGSQPDSMLARWTALLPPGADPTWIAEPRSQAI